MIKEFSLNKTNAILNFTIKYCNTSEELLNSTGFLKVLSRYHQKLHKTDASLLERIETKCDSDSIEDSLITLFKMLLIADISDIKTVNPVFNSLLDNPSDLIEFIEGLYNYWRSIERYALIESSEHYAGIQNMSFITSSENFSNLILLVYRTIEEKIFGYKQNIYRQLNAGVNAGVVLTTAKPIIPDEYSKLHGIKFIDKIILNPPFIIYPKQNTRSGFFTEVDHNLLDDSKINKTHYFCYPAKVGESLAFVYFHRDFMSHGVSLSNLFELAKPSEYDRKKPNLIYVFGSKLKSKENKTVYYSDKKNDLYVGFVSTTDEIDYFGYMKKMILTLHNTRMIDKGFLPIHGAMVNITLKNGKTSNVAIVGDSGAGKSESLEAFRKLSEKYLKEMKIIFDDMGTFKIENGKVYGYGTETGAFVRLDDLENGFAFQAMDRAIFMNPNKVNARLLYPVSTYKDIIRGYKVDILLYANNYENSKNELVLFDNVDKAKDVFVKGLRKAKGTTTEKGLVESYFANPFGPHQRMEQTDIIIDSVFNQLFDNKIPVGEIYTKLAIDGLEMKGPESAAKKIFEFIMKD